MKRLNRNSGVLGFFPTIAVLKIISEEAYLCSQILRCAVQLLIYMQKCYL